MAEEKKESLKLFKFNEEGGSFEEVPEGQIPEGGIKELLANERGASFALFQMETYMVWLYHGEETSTKTKFMSARQVTSLRDDILIGGKILTVDEGSEPLPFKFATKMADPADYGIGEALPADFKPVYTGTEDERDMLKHLDLEKIALLLEQVPPPEDHEREAVVHDDQVYAIKNVRRCYMGTEIEEIELVPLPKDVLIESGTYMAAELHPRLMFENGKVLLVELLRKTERRRQQETLFGSLASQA